MSELGVLGEDNNNFTIDDVWYWTDLELPKKYELVKAVRDYQRENSDISELVWIYFFHNPVTGLTKIGRTKHLKNRFLTITREVRQTLPEVTLQCVLAWQDVKLMERLLHDAFWQNRVTGEWFRLSMWDVMQCLHIRHTDSESLIGGKSLETELHWDNLGRV